MIAVFFIYGLAFFSLGLSIAVHPKKHSNYMLAKNGWLIAAFGILHGFNEWVDMFIMNQEPFDVMTLQIIRTLLLPMSFICLLQFGINSVTEITNRHVRLRVMPVVFITAWVIIVFASSQRLLMADIWSRYLIAVPAVVLTSWGLLLQEAVIKKSTIAKDRWYLRFSAVAFLSYGFFAGIIVPKAEFFPASIINYSVVHETIGIPVQVFRTVCALVIAYGMIRVLEIFEWETTEELKKSRDTLEVTVKERTKNLEQANAELEKEIAERLQAEKERESLIVKLSNALDRVKLLSGLLPICSSCKKIRDDKGYWNQIEVYIRKHSEAQFSHGMCPECAHKLYPDLGKEKKNR